MFYDVKGESTVVTPESIYFYLLSFKLNAHRNYFHKSKVSKDDINKYM